MGALDVVAELGADEFGDPACRSIYEAAKGLIESGQSVNHLAVSAQLRATGELDDVGGPGWVLQLERTASCAPVDVPRFVQRLKDVAQARSVMSLAQKAARDGLTEALANPQAYVDRVRGEVLAAAEPRGRGDVLLAGSATAALWQEIERRVEHDEPAAATCGLRIIDELSLLRRGALVTIAGRPGEGKTALALGVAAGVAEAGGRVLFVSLEMSMRELMGRLASMLGPLDSRRIEHPRALVEEDWPRLNRGLTRISKMDLWIWATAEATVGGLQARASRLNAMKRLDLIVVDYLGLLRGPRSENRVQEVSAISRGLKTTAMALDVPLVALCQLNRAIESRTDPTPQLSDLRDSGAIEQDSDSVAFVWRPKDARESGMVLVAKNRHGPTADTSSRPLRFEARYQRFVDDDPSLTG